MKTIKFIILFCLVCSTAFMAFALWAEGGWLKSQKNDLAVTSTSTRAINIKQEFVAADENGKTKFFDDFVKHIQDRDKAISASINSSFELTQTVVYGVFAFNFLAAICVIYLLVKTKATD